MKPVNSRFKPIFSLALTTFCAVMLSFSPGKNGGEVFEIYLDGKLVMQQFGNDQKGVKSLQLDQRHSASTIMIKYNHCGRAGKNRNITIKDGKDNILKEWQFKDEPISIASMKFRVKEILDLRKSGLTTLKLYYSSSEMPKGRQLASLIVSNANVTSLSDR